MYSFDIIIGDGIYQVSHTYRFTLINEKVGPKINLS